MRIQSILIIALLALFLVPMGANAKMAFMPFNQIAMDADYIFVGTVIDKGSREGDAGSIWTDYTFHVDQRIAGTAGLDSNGNLLLSFAGGKIGPHSLTLTESLTFEEGDQVCLFIKQGAPDAMFPVIGGRQGTFRILKDGDRSLVTNNENHLVIGVIDGQIRIGSEVRNEGGNLTVIPSAISQVKHMPAPRSYSPDKVKITPVELHTKATDPGLATDLPEFVQLIQNLRGE